MFVFIGLAMVGIVVVGLGALLTAVGGVVIKDAGKKIGGFVIDNFTKRDA